MNLYFNYDQEILVGSLGRAEQMNELFERLEVAFDKFPAPNDSGTGFGDPLVVGYPTQLNHALQFGQFLTWQQDVSANQHSLVNLRDPIAAGDATPRAWVLQQIAAYLIAGGDPSLIQITSLNKGTLGPLQSVRANAAGTALEPYNTGDGSFDTSGFAAGALLRVNAAGTALESYSDRAIRTQARQAGYLN